VIQQDQYRGADQQNRYGHVAQEKYVSRREETRNEFQNPIQQQQQRKEFNACRHSGLVSGLKCRPNHRSGKSISPFMFIRAKTGFDTVFVSQCLVNALTGEVGDGTSLFGVRRAGTEIRKKASNKQRDATSPRNPH
jgi:hypothetical protein